MLGPPLLGRQYTSHLDSEDQQLNTLSINTGEMATTPTSQSGGALGLTRSLPERAIKMKYASATDIGGGQTNQDAFDSFELPEDNCVVFGVYDGHGRELGELASTVARDTIKAALSEPGCIARLRENSEEVLVEVFKKGHIAIREAFRQKYVATGWEVQDTEDGFLIKRQAPNQAWTCTHGGTTATVVVILDGWRMIVANVGDSTALWGGIDAEAQTLHRELSAEHSPESVEEFERVRKFRPADGHAPAPTGPLPEMRFVYDAPSFSKSQCPPIFELGATGSIRVTGNGRYYKNVRSEWATLVTTPPNARFQDALAFTRSLGDLHLHVYGVSCRPTVTEYDVTALHSLVSSADDTDKRMSVLLVCTDGVWDNWKYPDLVVAALAPEMVTSVRSDSNAQKATDRLMQANIRRAKEHFGSQADNMTAIVCYISF
jgi:serine/threonine protein phosphatase PrpC